MNIAGTEEVCIHPEDAEKEGINSGQNVRIGTKETAINIKAVVTDKVNKGEVLILNSFENNPVNRLLNHKNLATFERIIDSFEVLE